MRRAFRGLRPASAWSTCGRARGVDGQVGPKTASCLSDYVYFAYPVASGTNSDYQVWTEPGLV